MNKKLLVLGGAEIHCKVVRAAKEMGCYVIATDFLKDSPAKLLADENCMIDITDIDGLINLCREKKIDGVINTSLDPCQIPQMKVCHALGLPCYGTEEQYFKLTNKVAYKELCRKNGVDTIEDYSEEQIMADDGSVTYPVFIKPVDSRGSRGQSICYNKSDAIPAIEIAKKESSNGDVLIERYMKDKSDFMISYIVKDGIPHMVRLADRYQGKPEDGMDKVGALAVQPSKFSRMYLENVHERMVSMIKDLGIQNGPIFGQGFVDGDTVRFYDPGLRLPGGNYENLYKEANDVDIIKMLIEFSLTGKMSDNYGQLEENGYLLNDHMSAILFPMVRSGLIKKIIGEDYIKSLPQVVSYAFRHQEGEFVKATKTVNQRIGEINILTKDLDDLKQVISGIYDHLTVLDENGENMIVSKVDLSQL